MPTENYIIKITAESDLKKAEGDLQALKDRENDIMQAMRQQPTQGDQLGGAA